MALSLKRAIKRILPTRLFARALLILILPVVMLQMMVAHIFFDRHWDSVMRNMTNSVAADIAMLANEYRRLPEPGADADLTDMRRIALALGIRVQLAPVDDGPFVDGKGGKIYPELYENLKNRLDIPFMIVGKPHDDTILVRLAEPQSVLEFTISRKRLASSTTSIFIGWMVGFSALLMLIATLFLRNQVKPMVQLARAAEQFGLGHEVANFSPRGASEIKRAASAFLLMADRIRRTVATRTEMLAGISHDLRTPLTRMKLEIEMGKIDSATRGALESDIEEMRRMIDEYLDFARGDAGEPAEPVDIAILLTELVEMYARQGRPVRIGGCEKVLMMIRPQAMKRALSNLIDNALRYGHKARVEMETSQAFVRIKVIDYGPGIAEDDHEMVFKPFTRLEASRNVATGGVGLGLSIARDIAHSHGGTITLENLKDGRGQVLGLEVTMRLPRVVNR
jgi:two-component system osmolarity sensor histidine kinase EnvZ